MAVVEEFYDTSRKHRYPSALVAWLGSFLDERENMNRTLLAAQLKAAAGGDDAKLLQLEAQLRDRIGNLAQARVKALSGDKQAAMRMNADIITAATSLERQRIHEQGESSRTSASLTEDIEKKNIDTIARNRALMSYDPALNARMADVIDRFKGDPTDAANLSELSTQLGGIWKDAGGTGAGSKVQHDAMAAFAADYARRSGHDALADTLARQELGETDADAYMSRNYGGKTPEEMNALEQKLRAGGGSLSDFGHDLLSGGGVQIGQELDGGIPSGGETIESETTTYGGGDGGEEAGMRPSGFGIRTNLDPRVALQLARALQGGNQDEIDRAFDAAQAGLEKQIDTIEAERTRHQQPLVGANYLLDNPFTFVRPPKIAQTEWQEPREDSAFGVGLADSTARDEGLPTSGDNMDRVASYFGSAAKNAAGNVDAAEVQRLADTYAKRVKEHEGGRDVDLPMLDGSATVDESKPPVPMAPPVPRMPPVRAEAPKAKPVPADPDESDFDAYLDAQGKK